MPVTEAFFLPCELSLEDVYLFRRMSDSKGSRSISIGRSVGTSMERQHIEERYSDVGTVKAVLEIEFPRYKYPDFFKNNPKGFDVHVRNFLIIQPAGDDHLGVLWVGI